MATLFSSTIFNHEFTTGSSNSNSTPQGSFSHFLFACPFSHNENSGSQQHQCFFSFAQCHNKHKIISELLYPFHYRKQCTKQGSRFVCRFVLFLVQGYIFKLLCSKDFQIFFFNRQSGCITYLNLVRFICFCLYSVL